MKKKAISVIVVTVVIACVVWFACVVFAVRQKQHESVEIVRVFRELSHSRTTFYLDEIDVQDCPEDFQRAYSTFVLETRTSGISMSKKELALSKLQDTARLHGVTFKPKAR